MKEIIIPQQNKNALLATAINKLNHSQDVKLFESSIGNVYCFLNRHKQFVWEGRILCQDRDLIDIIEIKDTQSIILKSHDEHGTLCAVFSKQSTHGLPTWFYCSFVKEDDDKITFTSMYESIAVFDKKTEVLSAWHFVDMNQEK